MENILEFFTTLSYWHKVGWIVSILSFCWLLEYAVPLVKFRYNKIKHILFNLTFLMFSAIINIFVSFLVVMITMWGAEHQFGLLYLIELPFLAMCLISLVIFDLFVQYFAHYLLHKIPFLFRFHMVHHSDTRVDATTATRHHPGDIIFRESLALLVIFLFGIPLVYYIMYRLLTLFFGYTSHANMIFPRVLDRTIGWMFITPNMHKFHHHQKVIWTDSNYGNIFSIWDRLFGTLVIDDPSKVVYGLDILDPKDAQNMVYQLMLPLNKSIKNDDLTCDDLKCDKNATV